MLEFPKSPNCTFSGIINLGNKRKKIAESLVSDRDNTRQYSSKIIQRQNEYKTAGDPTPKVENSQGSEVAALSSSRKTSVSEATTSKKSPKKLNFYTRCPGRFSTAFS